MGASRSGERANAAEGDMMGVRLGAGLRGKVKADAKRLGLTSSAVLRQIIDLHYRRQEDQQIFERLSEYLQQLTREIQKLGNLQQLTEDIQKIGNIKQLIEDIQKIRRDTKGQPQRVTRLEEAIRAFRQEFKASLVGHDDEDDDEE